MGIFCIEQQGIKDWHYLFIFFHCHSQGWNIFSLHDTLNIGNRCFFFVQYTFQRLKQWCK